MKKKNKITVDTRQVVCVLVNIQQPEKAGTKAGVRTIDSPKRAWIPVYELIQPLNKLSVLYDIGISGF